MKFVFHKIWECINVKSNSERICFKIAKQIFLYVFIKNRIPRKTSFGSLCRFLLLTTWMYKNNTMKSLFQKLEYYIFFKKLNNFRFGVILRRLPRICKITLLVFAAIFMRPSSKSCVSICKTQSLVSIGTGLEISLKYK
ncbi:hypothetical protein B1J94_01865 [Leptospira kirschneri serovar Grippotyphosa]|nr:hypothetical protein B1J94_01865 [Leptospira kirschneri serovar Grippotyphosa]